MVVSTLPRIGTPSIKFFHTVDILDIALLLVVMAGAEVFNLLASYSLILFACMLRHRRSCNENTSQHRFKCCCRCMKNTFLSVGRLLCVQTFPVLFKMHKTRSDHGRQTRKFMLFLDREVERSWPLIAAFCSIVYSIFCSFTMVFVRYFPVEESNKCLEEDKHGRTLFCYSNSSLINSSLPVDCADFSVTELQELKFQCYAIALPGLGIAVAAGLGLAKVAIAGITIYIKATEAFFHFIASNIRQKLQQVYSTWMIIIIIVELVYCALSSIIIIIASYIIFSLGLQFIGFHTRTDSHPVHFFYYYAYISLPWQICYPLVIITFYLVPHCIKGEYISIVAEQRPPDPRDRDGESQSSESEPAMTEQESMQTGFELVSVNGEDPDENEETVIIGARTHEYGATTPGRQAVAESKL